MKMKKRSRLLSVLLSLSLVAGLAAGLGFRAQDAMAMNEKNDNFASAKGDVEIHEAYSSRIDEVNEAGTYYFHMYSRYDDGPDHYVNNAMYTAIRNEDGTLTKKSVSGVTIGPRVNAYVSPDDYTVEGDEENPENVYSLHFMYTIEVSDQCEENCCVIQDYSGVYASKPDGFTWSEDDLGSALNICMQNEEPSEEIRAWTSEKGDVPVDEATKVNDDSKVEHDVRSGIKTYYVHMFSTEKDISHYQLRFGVWKDGSAKFYSSLEGVTLGDWTKATDSSENNYHYFAEVKIDTKIAESFEFMAVSDEVDASDGKTYMKEGSENYEDPYGGNCWLMMDYYNIGDPLSDEVEAWTSELGDVPKDEAEQINEENKVEEKDKSGIKSYYVHLYSEGTDISNYKIRFGSWGDEDYAVWVPSVDGATLGPWQKASDCGEDSNYHYFAKIDIDLSVESYYEVWAIKDDVDAPYRATYAIDGHDYLEEPYEGNAWAMMDVYIIESFIPFDFQVSYPDQTKLDKNGKFIPYDHVGKQKLDMKKGGWMSGWCSYHWSEKFKDDPEKLGMTKDTFLNRGGIYTSWYDGQQEEDIHYVQFRMRKEGAKLAGCFKNESEDCDDAERQFLTSTNSDLIATSNLKLEKFKFGAWQDASAEMSAMKDCTKLMLKSPDTYYRVTYNGHYIYFLTDSHEIKPKESPKGLKDNPIIILIIVIADIEPWDVDIIGKPEERKGPNNEDITDTRYVDGSELVKTVFKNGNITVTIKVLTMPNGRTKQYRIEEDPYGNKTEKLVYEGKKSVEEKEVITNDKGTTVKETCTTEKNNKTSVEEVNQVLDINGNITGTTKKVTTDDPDNNIQSETNYIWDKKGEMAKTDARTIKVDGNVTTESKALEEKNGHRFVSRKETNQNGALSLSSDEIFANGSSKEIDQVLKKNGKWEKEVTEISKKGKKTITLTEGDNKKKGEATEKTKNCSEELVFKSVTNKEKDKKLVLDDVKKFKGKTFEIPKKVEANDVKYSVTKIGAEALEKNKKYQKS